jgi:NAD-dependent SIR2 family protein deacetylase
MHVGRLVATDDGESPSDRPRPLPQTPRVIHTLDLAEWLQRHPSVVLTGAGISRASGIPPFTGPGSLATPFPLEERFPGSVFDWAVHRPAELASILGSFHAAVLTARPNRAHLALADLETRGVVKQVLTTNFDDLHQGAGSVRVKRLEPGGDWTADLSARALLVTGASRDDFGVVSAARTLGMSVVVLNPEVPELVQESDLFLPGRAEDVLPEVQAVLCGRQGRIA